MQVPVTRWKALTVESSEPVKRYSWEPIRRTLQQVTTLVCPRYVDRRHFRGIPFPSCAVCFNFVSRYSALRCTKGIGASPSGISFFGVARKPYGLGSASPRACAPSCENLSLSVGIFLILSATPGQPCYEQHTLFSVSTLKPSNFRRPSTFSLMKPRDRENGNQQTRWHCCSFTPSPRPFLSHQALQNMKNRKPLRLRKLTEILALEIRFISGFQFFSTISNSFSLLKSESNFCTLFPLRLRGFLFWLNLCCGRLG